MSPRPDEICPRPVEMAASTTRPLSPAIFPTSVWICNDTTEAEQVLGGDRHGYVYQRHGHPNADALAQKCRQLHAAEQAVMTASGMSALAVALLTQLASGDHVVAARQLYGHTLRLLTEEISRLGIWNRALSPEEVGAIPALKQRV